MKAVIIDQEKAFVTNVPQPSFDAESDQLLIKVHSAAQNPKDYKAHFILKMPDCVEGSDIAGVVEKVGKKAEEFGFKVGDRVAAMIARGGFAEYAISHAHTAFRIPDSLGFDEASTLPLCYITAALGFFLWLPHPYPSLSSSSSSSSPSTTVIIYGASTSCGLYAVQLAKLANLRVIAIAGKSLAQVTPFLGSDDVAVDYRSPDWESKVREASRGEQLLYGYDYFSSDKSVESVAKFLAPGGKVSIVFPVNAANISVTGVTILELQTAHAIFGEPIKFPGMSIEYPADMVAYEFAKQWYRFLEQWLAQGKLKANKVTLMGGLEKVQEGIEKMMEGDVSGEKLVYRI